MSRASGRLEIELTAPLMSFRELVWSDYEAALREHDEPTHLMKLLYLPRLLLDPSLQLAFLVRLAQKSPRILLHVVRWLQVILFSSEVYKFYGDDAIVVGPAIVFPHPFNIIIGGGVKIGAGVTIYNNCTLGANRHTSYGGEVGEAPRIGDRVVIYGYSAIQGPYDVGEDAVVGLHVVLHDHVPSAALRSYRKLHLPGEWRGEDRRTWRMKRPSSRTTDGA